MILLLDTHVVLWWLKGDSRLSERARKLLGDSFHQRWVSHISLWEIAIKANLGKLDTGDRSIEEIAQMLRSQEFQLLPLQLEHVSRVAELPNLHRDPFDRMLIAQAQELGIPLVTNDTKIKQYPVKTLW